MIYLEEANGLLQEGDIDGARLRYDICQLVAEKRIATSPQDPGPLNLLVDVHGGRARASRAEENIDDESIALLQQAQALLRLRSQSVATSSGTDSGVCAERMHDLAMDLKTAADRAIADKNWQMAYFLLDRTHDLATASVALRPQNMAARILVGVVAIPLAELFALLDEWDRASRTLASAAVVLGEAPRGLDGRDEILKALESCRMQMLKRRAGDGATAAGTSVEGNSEGPVP